MNCGRRNLQLTLAILKPDLVSMPLHLEHVRSVILRNNFFILQSQVLNMSRSKAEEFYAEHSNKFFFNRLVTYMSSGPCHVHIMARENAISEWRKLMGMTKVFRTRYLEPGSIRGQVGLTDTRNSTHGSDSDETARQEMIFFFPTFDRDQIVNEVFPKIPESNLSVMLDRVKFVHTI